MESYTTINNTYNKQMDNYSRGCAAETSGGCLRAGVDGNASVPFDPAAGCVELLIYGYSTVLQYSCRLEYFNICTVQL